MKRIVLALSVVAAVAACVAPPGTDSPSEAIQAAAFRASDAPSLTLFTMVNNRTGSGGHTALMVSGSQRVIFDPAGSFRDSRVVERGDVLYGITPGWLQAYKSAHARETFHVVSQTIAVSPETAERALQLVQANGPVAGAFCAQSTTAILAQLNGFEGIERTFFPVNVMEQFATLPGVTTTKLYENDAGDVIDAVRAAELAQ